ncbi:MAG: 30S ribosomal protein S1 [Elusimicrobia bacterium]|nr:30S ribosomal protein S1 [Candidatus Liberimonas magnetica]
MDETKEAQGKENNLNIAAPGALEGAKEQKEKKEEDVKMEELMGDQIIIEEGKIVKVKIVGKNAEGVLVDLGVKSEAPISKSEFGSQEKYDEINVGMEIPVYIVRLHSREGSPVVSYKQAREIYAWEKIKASFASSSPIEGVIVRKIKGGFIVDTGIDAFLPFSQLEIYRVKDFNAYLGIKMKFLITDMDKDKNNLVLSRRKLLELEQNESKKRVLENIYENQVIDGVVTRITDFGAFVDIGGMEGLLHIGDIAWHRLNKVGDKLSVRQSIKVKVLKIEGGRVSLGMKQLIPTPWEKAGEKYPKGSIVKGKVISITEFGVFIEIEPGLEGLLHVSEISWSEQKSDVLKKFKAGQELDVKVIDIDTVSEKLSLSVKKLKSNPWEEAKTKFPKGTKVKGTVTNITPFGAFVKIADGMEGLIHIGEMSWTKKVNHPKDVLKTGQEIESVVLDINPIEEKISLSLRHLEGNPFEKYSTGKVVTGKVKRITDFGAFIELEPGIDALLRASEIIPKKMESAKRANISDFLKVGQEIEAKIVKSDLKERKIDISTKKLEREREKELLKKYTNKESRPTLGDVLEEE